MFNITAGKGFHMTFVNGWTVSVQWGYGNYCDNKNYDRELREPPPACKTAEVAAWSGGGRWYDFGSNTVDGFKTPDEVAAFIAKIAAMPRA